MKSKTKEEGLPNIAGFGYNRRKKNRYFTRDDAIESPYVDKATAMEANNGALPPCIQDLCSRFSSGLTYVFNFLCAYEMYENPEGMAEGQS